MNLTYVIAFHNFSLQSNHFRKTGENTFEPLSDHERTRLSNVEQSIEIDDSDNNDHHDSSNSDSDEGC